MFFNTTIALLILNSSARRFGNSKSEIHYELVNNSLVIEVVNSINRLYEFESFVFFVSPRLANDSLTASDFFLDFWRAFPSAPVILIVHRPIEMAGFLSAASLCLVLTTATDDPIMEMTALSMKSIRFIKTIFILYPLVRRPSPLFASLDEQNLFRSKISLLYEWVWRKQFLNTMLITKRNNVYVHEPYPTPNIINRTGNWLGSDFFVDYSGNFKGYQIKTSLHHDLPRVFRMTRFPLGRATEPLSGVSGKMFLSFVEAVNATFNATVELNPNRDAVLERDLVAHNNLEISVNTYTAMMPSFVGSSYPIGINNWCIMVPYQNRSPELSYIKGTFRSYSWYLLMFSIFYITLGIWLCTPSSERDLALAFLQSICSLVLIAPLRFLNLPYLRLRFLFIILFLMGFFITNMYLSKITSFFTTPTPQKQIDTVQDVVEHKLPIMVMDYEYEKLKMENYSQEFLDLLVVGSKSDMNQHRDSLNNSYGYSTQTDRWWFVDKQQASLKKPLFRPTTICIGPFYHVFPIPKDSHLAKPLQDFILAAYQYGLMFHWQAQAFLDALFMGYARMILIELHPVPLTLTYFRPIWFLWWFGMILAGLSFILEVKAVTFSFIKKELRKALRWLRVKVAEL